MLQKIVFFFGERLAFILFFIFVTGFLFFKDSQQVFSEPEDPSLVKQGAYWYEENISFPIASSQASNDFEISIATITPTPIAIPVDPANTDIWERLADCESHRNWSADTGNGYYGGLQFTLSAWQGVGGTGNPSLASRDEQINRGRTLQAKRGWFPWGACSKKLGLL